MNIPHDALFQNGLNGSASLNRKTVRASDKKSFKRHLLLNHWHKFKIISPNCSSWCNLPNVHKLFLLRWSVRWATQGPRAFLFTQIIPTFALPFPIFYLYWFVEGHLDALFYEFCIWKKPLWLMFYIQIQYFFSCFFFHLFYLYSFPTFCGRALESLFICSFVPVQPRLAYLDITEKILTNTQSINITKKSHIWLIPVLMVVKTCQDLELKLRYSCRPLNK